MILGFICPTCGCSLIRLGIKPEKAPTAEFEGRTYHFCCEECKAMFLKGPEKYVAEVEDLFVCPVCLGEKHRKEGVALKFQGRELYFCRCPHCAREFSKNPEYYLRRLEGKEPFSGVFGSDFQCC